jgi:SAM-dependent methyltransferase
VAESLEAALAALRPALLDAEHLVRAVGAGRRRRGGAAPPRWERAELRPVDLKAGRHLQVVTYAEGPPLTRNEPLGAPAEAAVDELLAQPFGNWHVQTTTETVQLRVTKKGDAQVHRSASGTVQHTGHDRTKPHLIDPGDPLFGVLGAGASKRRQVDAFLRALAPAVDDAPLPADRPLRVVDLGCGNAYLTFAAYRYLASTRDVELVGVDLRAEARERNTAIAAELGWSDNIRFVEGSIAASPVPEADVVLALHACDTATDDALAQAVRWQSPLVLAAPCCHHDLQRQLKVASPPPAYGLVTRHAILRERLGDALTDALRAALLRREGYRAEVLQFVDAEYTPRNTMIRAVRTGAAWDAAAEQEYAELTAAWGVSPFLQALLDAGQDAGTAAS